VKDGAGKVYSEGSLAATRPGPGRLDENAATAVERGDGSDYVHRWIYDHLKPHAAALKVAHPLMLRAIGRREEKERSYRRRQDLRLLAVRFSAGVLHGSDGDSRTKAHPALPQPTVRRWCR